MKSTILTRFLAPGCVLAVLLAGCFNPITMVPPKSGDPVTDPFTIDTLIDKDGSARSVAGPDSTRIKGGKIRNFVQLVVADDSGKIAAFAEDRRQSDENEAATLTIDSIEFGKTYHFLLLMGHWEHDGNYRYFDTSADFRPPTLLAAGLKTQPVTGSGKITVVMWPVVVDTEFASGSRTAAPKGNGMPGMVSLLPLDWKVTWTVKKGASGDGFADMVTAQKAINAAAGDNLKVKSKQTIVKVAGQDESAPVTSNTDTGNVITLASIGSYVQCTLKFFGSILKNIKKY